MKEISKTNEVNNEALGIAGETVVLDFEALLDDN